MTGSLLTFYFPAVSKNATDELNTLTIYVIKKILWILVTWNWWKDIGCNIIRDFTQQFAQIFTSLYEKDLGGMLEGMPVVASVSAVLIKLLNHEIYKENVYKFMKTNSVVKIKITKYNYFLVWKDVRCYKERLEIIKR